MTLVTSLEIHPLSDLYVCLCFPGVCSPLIIISLSGTLLTPSGYGLSMGRFGL